MLDNALGSRDSNAQVFGLKLDRLTPISPLLPLLLLTPCVAEQIISPISSLPNSSPFLVVAPLATTCDELLSSLEIADNEISSFSFSEECVMSALSHLKPGKCDGSPHSSNYLIKASSVLVYILSPLLTALVRHSYLPADLRNCILMQTYSQTFL